MIKLAKLLAKDEKIVYTYAIENTKELEQEKNIINCKTLQEIKQNAEIFIGPIPFSSNGRNINTPFSNQEIPIETILEILQGKTLLAGAISPEIQEKANIKNVKIIDLMKNEELTIFNTIATAEGTIQVAISNTDINIQESNILILGFGRVAKVVAQKMKNLDAKVTCAARKEQDIAWIKTYGYQAININTMGKNLNKYDIIINTVPYIILTKERLQNVKEDCLLIDLASKPGGIDTSEVKTRKLKYIWALALPGKVAPATTAKYIKETIYQITQ